MYRRGTKSRGEDGGERLKSVAKEALQDKQPSFWVTLEERLDGVLLRSAKADGDYVVRQLIRH